VVEGVPLNMLRCGTVVALSPSLAVRKTRIPRAVVPSPPPRAKAGRCAKRRLPSPHAIYSPIYASCEGVQWWRRNDAADLRPDRTPILAHKRAQRLESRFILLSLMKEGPTPPALPRPPVAGPPSVPQGRPGPLASAGAAPSLGISAGSAAAALVKTLRVTKARMGERSMVPPMGGMMPRKRFR